MTRQTRIASIKADVAFLMGQHLDPVSLETAVKKLGGELGVGLSRGTTAAYFPHNSKGDKPVSSLVVTYRIDETGHVVTVAIDDLDLLE